MGWGFNLALSALRALLSWAMNLFLSNFGSRRLQAFIFRLPVHKTKTYAYTGIGSRMRRALGCGCGCGFL
jgi:hypothetical protein